MLDEKLAESCIKSLIITSLIYTGIENEYALSESQTSTIFKNALNCKCWINPEDVSCQICKNSTQHSES